MYYIIIWQVDMVLTMYHTHLRGVF